MFQALKILMLPNLLYLAKCGRLSNGASSGGVSVCDAAATSQMRSEGKCPNLLGSLKVEIGFFERA